MLNLEPSPSLSNITIAKSRSPLGPLSPAHEALQRETRRANPKESPRSLNRPRNDEARCEQSPHNRRTIVAQSAPDKRHDPKTPRGGERRAVSPSFSVSSDLSVSGLGDRGRRGTHFRLRHRWPWWSVAGVRPIDKSFGGTRSSSGWASSVSPRLKRRSGAN